MSEDVPKIRKPVLLDDAEQHELLSIARRTIEIYLTRGLRPNVETETEALLRPAGAFVTLHLRSGQLRGCIGTFETDQPLVDTVTRMAVAAASCDPRFPPLQADEVPQLRLEISVLSPRWVASADDVVVGQHGLYLRRGEQRGVLLPQVALEAGWDRETFLDATCRKAGLPAGAWRDSSTVIELFTAQVFGEEP